MADRPPVLYVSWTDHHRGSDLMHQLGGRYVVPAPWCGTWPWPVRYLVQALATVGAVLRARPRTIVFMSPPTPAGLACLLAGRLVGARCWADCHSGTFNDPRWSRFSGLTELVLARCAGAIFHNYPQRRAHGGQVARGVCVTTDGFRRRPHTPADPEPYVLVPASYGFDEPIDAVLAAAAEAPHVRLVLSGRADDALRARALPNTSFSGFVSAEEYEALVAGASAVLCLTTRQGTMQGGVLEALEHRRPAITSRTDALAEWAAEIPGVLLIPDHEAATIAGALTDVVRDRRDAWAEDAAEGQRRTEERAQGELDGLRAQLRV